MHLNWDFFHRPPPYIKYVNKYIANSQLCCCRLLADSVVAKRDEKLCADFIDFLYICGKNGAVHTHTRETTLLMWWKKERKKSEDANRDGGPSNRIGQGAGGNPWLDLARAGRRVPCPVHGVGMQFEWMRCDTHHTRQKYDASVSLWDHKSCAYVCISHGFKRAAFDRKNEGNGGLSLF